MSTASETAIREQAYYFWEQDGRPPGRENEYWQRAVIALTEAKTAATLTKPAPKKASKAQAAAKPAAVKAAPKLKAAASKAKPAPAKTAKAEPAKPAKAPKKK